MHTIDIVIFREGDQWVARALNVEVASFGDSRDEARAAIEEALALYFEDEPSPELREVAEVSLDRLHV